MIRTLLFVLTLVALSGLVACGARWPATRQTDDPPARHTDPADLDDAAAHLAANEARLDEALATLAGPSACDDICPLVGEICGLATRICAIAERRADLPEAAIHCEDGRTRCRRARERAGAACPTCAPAESPGETAPRGDSSQIVGESEARAGGDGPRCKAPSR